MFQGCLPRLVSFYSEHSLIFMVLGLAGAAVQVHFYYFFSCSYAFTFISLRTYALVHVPFFQVPFLPFVSIVFFSVDRRRRCLLPLLEACQGEIRRDQIEGALVISYQVIGCDFCQYLCIYNFCIAYTVVFL